MIQLYECQGKHFKVYNSKVEEVLEHPDEDTGVIVNFGYNENDLIINVTGFLKKPMRKIGQKNRGDIYIFQKDFKPFLPILDKLLKDQKTVSDPEEKWRFGNPVERDGRQSVPNCFKLAEVSEVILTAPFDEQSLRIEGFLIVDSEIPGRDQSLWAKQGGGRQIHIGVWGSVSIIEKKSEAVDISIPLKKLENNFLKTIQEYWID